MMKQAVILAAGTGRQLGVSYPKALLCFGNETIFERAVHSLYEEGIGEIVVVTGYEEGQLCALANRLRQSLSGLEIVCVSNDRYGETNNLYSLWLARSLFSTEGFVLLNSDVLFHSGILRLLLMSEHETAISVDHSKELEEEDMKVKLDNKGCFKEISKEINLKEAYGEYLGLAKFGSNSATLLSEALDGMVRQGHLNLFYESAVQVICGDVDIYAVSTNQLPWIEIDAYKDLEKAGIEIYPSLDAISER